MFFVSSNVVKAHSLQKWNYLVIKCYREHCMKAKVKVNRSLIGKNKVLKIHL